MLPGRRFSPLVTFMAVLPAATALRRRSISAPDAICPQFAEHRPQVMLDPATVGL
jgi:hypothetical protein